LVAFCTHDVLCRRAETDIEKRTLSQSDSKSGTASNVLHSSAADVTKRSEIPSLTDAIDSVTAWWSKTPECAAAVDAFNPANALADVGAYLNPFTWIMSFHNVMEIDSELDDLEELDNRPDVPASAEPRQLSKEAFLENLRNLEPTVVAEMWVQWSKEAGFTHLEFIEWLRTSFADTSDMARHMPPGFKPFVAVLYEMGIWAPAEKRKLKYLVGDASFLSGGHPAAPRAPEDKDDGRSLSSVDPVFRDPEGCDAWHTAAFLQPTLQTANSWRTFS